MSRAGAKIITKANVDHALIELARRLSDLRSQEIEAGSHAARCDDALVAANVRVDSITDEIDDVYEHMLALTPTTPEGQRALALAIVQKCADTNELYAPESQFERGVGALLLALGADPRVA